MILKFQYNYKVNVMNPTKLQENVLCWYSDLSYLENNILKVLKNSTTGSGPSFIVKKMATNG